MQQKVEMQKYRTMIWFPILFPLLNLLSMLFTDSHFDISKSIPFLLGAIGEELFYRWFMLQRLLLPRTKPIYAILLVSAFFACMHFFNLRAGAPLGETLLQVTFAFCFSIWAGAVVWKTDSILIPLAAHVLLNLTSTDTLNVTIVLIMSVFVLVDGVLLLRTGNQYRR